MTAPRTAPPTQPVDPITDRIAPALLVSGGLLAGGLALVGTKPWHAAVGWLAAVGCVAAGTRLAARGFRP